MTIAQLSRQAIAGGRLRLVPLLAAGVGIALVVFTFVSVATGPVPLSLADVLDALRIRATGVTAEGIAAINEKVVWDLRLVRVLMAMAVGASLATCGAAMQGLFGNPLADPGIIGVSSGASLGAVAVIVLNLSAFGIWTLPAGAFVSGVATTFLIYVLARPGMGEDNSRLLLVGIAINSIAGAITGYFTYLANTDQLESIIFWGMGSLARASWAPVAIVVPLAAVGVALLMTRSRHLDLLALGERQATHLGVDVKSLRRGLIMICALLVAAAVSFTGTIGFVGLVVPHLFRLIIGPGHRLLIPFCAVGGALLLMVADLAARTLDPPSEVPIGILTSSLGGPFFLWLIYSGRGRRKATA